MYPPGATLYIQGGKVMLKKLVILLFALVLLTSCTYQAYERPDKNNDEVWICEEPYFELYWHEDAFGGKLIVDETEYSVVHTQDHGVYIWIYEDNENLDLRYESKMEYCLFRGRVNYGKEKMTITVDVDYKNVFGGEKPTFELIKHSKN